MASLRDQFQHFYAPGEDAIATAIKTGLVTPDANVLLSLYRFQREAREELFDALEKVGERLWIPYQVGLEFHRNRLTVMSEQEGYFTKALRELMDSIDTLRSKVRAFRARIALDTDKVQEIEDTITRLKDLTGAAVLKAQESNEVYLDGHASDDVLVRIDALFESRVGEPMSADELTAAREEAQRRIRDQVPPGYKDRDKDDPTGDYFVWKQLMLEAKNRKLPVVLITDDRKEDWYQEFKGRTLGARRELREEMMAEAGMPLLIMTTETFLLQAGKYLNVEVSQETVDQAKELVELPQVPVHFSHSPNMPQRPRIMLEAWLDRQALAGASRARRDMLARFITAELEKALPEDDQARRETFAELVRMLPADSGINRDAAKFIADFLVSDQATRDDIHTILAWLVAWSAQREDSPGEPPTEG